MRLTTTVSPPVEFGLRVTGIWPGSSCSILYRFVWMICLCVPQVFQFRYMIACVRTNTFLNLVECMSTTLPYSLLCLKLIILWLNQRLFNDILTSMSRDWRNCDALNLRIMLDKATLSRHFSRIIIGVYSIAVVCYVTVMTEINNSSKSGEGNRQLFLQMELPFCHESSPTYEIVMLVLFVQLLSSASAIAMLDALVVTLILHAGGQMDIVRRGLFKLFGTRDERKSRKKAIETIVRKHQNIITFSDSIENLFTYIALMQFLTNTLVICCIAFVIVISVKNNEFVILLRSMFFYIAITLEAFIFCFAGEYLSNKVYRFAINFNNIHYSKSIANAAYETLWYDAKPSESRVMLFLIMRSQKGLTLTIGKFNNLSLQGFGSVLKASASYVSVLLAMS